MNKIDTKKMSLKSSIFCVGVILFLMIFTYVLTFIIPNGTYARTFDSSIGYDIIEIGAEFTPEASNLTWWKFILSPVLVLTIDGNTTLIAVLIFLLILGGTIAVLKDCDFINYLIKKLTYKFAKKKYLLMCLFILFFMLLGSFIGSFEEVIPLVPIITILFVSLGFDEIVGVLVSLVAVGFGFSCGIMNPFTVGLAQTMVGLQLFSGVWFRILAFVLFYLLLVGFCFIYAKKVEKKNDNQETEINQDFKNIKVLDESIVFFAIVLGLGILFIISSSFITALQDYTMVIILLVFLIGGIGVGFITKMKFTKFIKIFLKGILDMLPAVALVLLASSIRYILIQGNIQDSIIYECIKLTQNVSKEVIVLFMFLLVLFMEIFIPSGSAKAIILIPTLIAIGASSGISPQLIIVAFAFGDGFSNILYPTNVGLLLALSLSELDYGKYIKKVGILFVFVLLLSCLLLVFGVVIGYN